MNPIFFGRAPKALFGVYHPPKARESRSTGVVLCYPFGQEYMRAHRAFRQMAMLLSRAGFHVLRFDYSATGDSSGDAADARVADWVDDARAAADELRETAGVPKVAFVGLRLGAAIAAMAAQGRDDVSDVVLWDPAVSGHDYLAEILEERTDSAGNSRRSVAAGGTVGVTGFPLTAAMQADIAAIDLQGVGAPRGPSRRLVIASRSSETYDALARHSVDGVRTTLQVVPSEGSWTEVDDYGGVLIPVALIQAIVGTLSREAV